MAHNPITEIDEMIKNGDIDITTIEAVENEADKRRREKEPDAYALTYDESVTILRANNIFEAVALRNGYITIDDTTGSRVYSMDDTVSELTIAAFRDHGIDADELKTLIDRVYDGDFFSIMLSSSYEPEPGKMGFSMMSQINGVKQSGILKIEDYPTIYTSTSRTEEREALGLPPSAKYLYGAEYSIVSLLRHIFYTGEEIVLAGTLAPYSQMPNALAFSFVSRFLNNRKIQEKPHSGESITLEPGDTENEIKIILETPNSVSTLTISDCLQFFDAPADKKVKRGTMDGVKRVWRYVLQQLMNQTHGREMPETILINLQDMVDIGMYANVDNAYRGIETMIQKMGLLHISQNFQVTETDQDGKRTRSKKNKGGFLFYGSTRSGYHANVGVNRMFGFEYYKQQYTYFPSAWAYKLAGVPFSLTEYVFSMMRQRAQELRDKGKFKITLETLQAQLGIKSVDDVRNNHGRKFTTYIKDPIIKAVNEVNAAAKKDKSINGKFKIVLKVPTTNDIDVWLSKGYIEVSANGEYTDYLTPIAEGRQLYTTTHRETLKAEKIKRAATRRARSEANEGAPRRGRKPKQRS